MQNIIKDFEKILYNSMVYYPNKKKNIASTFRVTLPEIYYDKYKNLNERQKKIIACFTNIFLNKLQKSEKVDNANIKSNFLNFKIKKEYLLNKQNIMQYLINFFSDCLDPYQDLKMLENSSYEIPIEGNCFVKSCDPFFIGSTLKINQCGCSVAIRLNSHYQNKVIEFVKVHNIPAFYLECREEKTLYFTVTFFDGNICHFRKSFSYEINEFNLI